MNNPSPLIPEGSPAEQKNNNRARVRMAVSCVLALHLVGLLALLMQGCRKPPVESDPAAAELTNTPPAFETSYVPPVETNLPPTPYVAETNLPSPMPMAPASQEYVIVRGDNFATLATRFGVSAKAIQEANPDAVPTRLRIGQKIIIPAPATSTVAPAPMGGTAAVASGEQIYKVKSGDNLTKIATAHGVTVRALRSANNLTTDRIRVGQELKIPAKAGDASAAPATQTP